MFETQKPKHKSAAEREKAAMLLVKAVNGFVKERGLQPDERGVFSLDIPVADGIPIRGSFNPEGSVFQGKDDGPACTLNIHGGLPAGAEALRLNGNLDWSAPMSDDGSGMEAAVSADQIAGLAETIKLAA